METEQKIPEMAEQLLSLFSQQPKERQMQIQQRNIGYMDGLKEGYDEGYADGIRAAQAAG